MLSPNFLRQILDYPAVVPLVISFPHDVWTQLNKKIVHSYSLFSSEDLIFPSVTIIFSYLDYGKYMDTGEQVKRYNQLPYRYNISLLLPQKPIYMQVLHQIITLNTYNVLFRNNLYDFSATSTLT